MAEMTPTQQKVYGSMKVGATYSSYELRCSLSTLRALVKKGKVKSFVTPGYLFSPRTNILFRRVE